MIRQAVTQDISRMREIYMIARRFMMETGNPNQWAKGYPPQDIHAAEIRNGQGFVDVKGGVIHGVFSFMLGEDPTYAVIEDGEWLNNEPYGTMHRIASSGEYKGMMGEYVAYCEKELKKRKICNLRGDTHADNRIMQHLFEKYGFKRCGIIHLANGAPRIAYQKVLSNDSGLYCSCNGKYGLSERGSFEICPVCGKYEFTERGGFEICPVCGWEDDPVQRREPDYAGGANKMSLNEAKQMWGKKEISS